MTNSKISTLDKASITTHSRSIDLKRSAKITMRRNTGLGNCVKSYLNSSNQRIESLALPRILTSSSKTRSVSTVSAPSLSQATTRDKRLRERSNLWMKVGHSCYFLTVKATCIIHLASSCTIFSCPKVSSTMAQIYAERSSSKFVKYLAAPNLKRLQAQLKCSWKSLTMQAIRTNSQTTTTIAQRKEKQKDLMHHLALM